MNKRLKLLAVLAHPDDESLGFGGTLARYAAEGVETYLVTATRGERGRFGSLGKGGDPVEVGRVREAELRAAAAVLGIREVSLLNYPDGAVDQVDAATAIRAVVSHIRRIQPEVVVTFGPEGAYGHPDHIAISQFTTAATVCAADCEYRTDSLPPHRVRKLHYLAWRRHKWEAYQTAFRKLTSMVDGVERQAAPWPDWAVTTEIDTSAWWPIAWKAVCCHQTQLSIYERLENLTEDQQTALWGSQEFYRAYSSVNGGRKPETDLFEGLRGTTMSPAGFLTILALTGSPLLAQEALTLRQAVDLASHSNPLIAATDAREKEAEARIHQAHSGYLPRLQFSESLQRGNNPAFVFSSLLTQHQFSDANFAIGSLNHPDAMNNYQSQLTVEQVVFDARQTSRNIEAARFTREIAGEDTRLSHSDITLDVLRAYFGVTLAEKNLEVKRQSVDSARADLTRAESIYQSGRSTQADVLALRVHLAAMQEQQIRASNEVAVARAALNDALGVSLDRRFELTTPLESGVGAPEGRLELYGRLAAENRPEMRQAELAQRLARTQRQIAGVTYWPQVAFQGIVGADSQNILGKGGVNWFTAVTLRWNFWNGGETRARADQARFAESRAEALRKRADSAIHLEVMKAYLTLSAAAQRVEVASAAAAEAEEANRIIQNRHQAGLIHDHRIAAAALEHAAGTLAADSALVN